MEAKHWTDQIASEMLKNKQKKQVIGTGTSLSGEPHLGSANDVIRGDAIRKAVEKAGGKAELIWIGDDLDPFRSVPAGFPEKLKDYLGYSVALIPDLFGCKHKNFAHHFETKLLEQLDSLGVKPTAYFGIEMYKTGMYNDSIITAMKKRKEIAAILNKYRKDKLKEDWYPINVICPKCGKIPTTIITSYDENKQTVKYECSTEEVIVHKKNTVKGCGHRAEASILNGNTKLTWRVEWPARWSFLKVTCEPFGKEHAAAGGSWDTTKDIVKLFGWNRPVPVRYEFFQVSGGKMSKSKGNVITVPILLEIMRPEEIKFWMYFGKIGKAREISLDQFSLHVAEEFDKAERIYFGEKTEDERDALNYKISYDLAVPKKAKRLIQVPYSTAAYVLQMVSGRERENFIQTGVIPKDITSEEWKSVGSRLENVRNWLKDYAPEEFKVKILENKPKIGVSEDLKFFYEDMAKQISKGISGGKLQEYIYNEAKERKLDRGKVFKTAYRLFLGKERGPRLGPFLVSLDREFVVNRLKLKA
jgi:lysyl-tRNA synthetase class 1